MWPEVMVVSFEKMKVSTLQDSMHEESNMESSVDVLRPVVGNGEVEVG